MNDSPVPSVALQLLPETRLIRREQLRDILGIHLLGARREADEVAEEDGDDLAFFLNLRRGPLGQWGAAEGAEGELARQLLAARSTCRHAGSL